MTAADVEAATKMQALQRGKSARKGDKQLIAAVEMNDLDGLEKLLNNGAEPTHEALVAALASPIRAMASRLVREQKTWGVGANELAVWNLIQTAMAPPAEEEEDEEEVDVEDPEWQEEIAAKVFGEAGGPNGVYVVRRIAAVGCYSGGRAHTPSEYEKEFDDELAERQGFGVQLGPKGGVYAGDWVAGQRDGVGVYWYKDQTVYCGEFREGMKHGNGRMVYADGGVYEGAWKYNKRHGHGVFNYPNGDLHVGKWFTGRKHGEGKYTSAASGTRFVGVWREGELERASVRLADGSALVSGFAAGQPVGAGAYIMASGACARGVHVKAEEEEEETEEPIKLLQWDASSITQADRTSLPKLAAMHGGAFGAGPPRSKCIIVAPEYADGLPPLQLDHTANTLRALMIKSFQQYDADVVVLSGQEATKEAVTEAISEMAAQLGRGDVAFVAFLGHGKRLLDLDDEQVDPDDVQEGICLADEAFTDPDVAEIISNFTERSTHLFLWIDSCFDGACLKEPPPNFCAISSTLAQEAPHTETDQSGAGCKAYFEHTMTEFLVSAIEAQAPPRLSYRDLHAALLLAQEAVDQRSAYKQMPMLYSKDPDDLVMQPMS